MKLSFYIAKRYLFSKKSHNVINVISLVTVCNVAVATLALVCILSVFNGLRGLVADMFSSFDPELKITPAKGKVFDPTTEKFLEIRSLPEIEVITESLEDNVLLRYRERQTPAVLKGVSGNFDRLVPVQDILLTGEFQLYNAESAIANPGVGIASVLGMYAGFSFPLEIYAPKRNMKTVNLSNPMSAFNPGYAYIGGVFKIDQPVYDDNYLLAPIALARELFDYTVEVSALELKLKEPAALPAVQKTIRRLLGDEYEVKNRYEQQEETFKMINIEKWVVFLIICFILMIAAANVIGSLSMLMVEKKKDIATLRNLGADKSLISRIFLLEGWMISALGAILGIVLGVLLCLGQQYFGWIKLGASGTFATDAYPVLVETSDLILILSAVLIIGFLAVIYPVRYFARTQFTSYSTTPASLPVEKTGCP